MVFNRCHGDLQEEADVRLAIQEALSMMVGAYANLQGALLNLMEALVAAYIVKVGLAGRMESLGQTAANEAFHLVMHSLVGKNRLVGIFKGFGSRAIGLTHPHLLFRLHASN